MEAGLRLITSGRGFSSAGQTASTRSKALTAAGGEIFSCTDPTCDEASQAAGQHVETAQLSRGFAAKQSVDVLTPAPASCMPVKIAGIDYDNKA